MHGEWYGNYEEFRFFTGLRQSEEFALQVEDRDIATDKINVTKAAVEEEMKNRTKTNQDREITLCPRALQVLRARFALRERMVAAGVVNHNFVFFSAVGEPLKRPTCPTTAGPKCWRRCRSGFGSRITLGTRIRAGA